MCQHANAELAFDEHPPSHHPGLIKQKEHMIALGNLDWLLRMGLHSRESILNIDIDMELHRTWRKMLASCAFGALNANLYREHIAFTHAFIGDILFCSLRVDGRTRTLSVQAAGG